MYSVRTSNSLALMHVESLDITKYVSITKNIDDNISIVFCLSNNIKIQECNQKLSVYALKKSTDSPLLLYQIDDSSKLQINITLSKHILSDHTVKYTIDRLQGNINALLFISIVHIFPL